MNPNPPEALTKLKKWFSHIYVLGTLGVAQYIKTPEIRTNTPNASLGLTGTNNGVLKINELKIQYGRPLLSGLFSSTVAYTANHTLSDSDIGKIVYVGKADGGEVTITVPATAVKNRFCLVVRSIATPSTIHVSPHADDAFYGLGVGVAVDKDLINSSPKEGDCLCFDGDGVDGYTVNPFMTVGTWDRQT